MLLQQCNSSDLQIGTAVISTEDSYYCGANLVTDGQTAGRIDIADGNGKVLAVIQCLAGTIGYAHDCPSQPVVALQGIVVTLTGTGEFVVRFAETISGLKRNV